MKVEEHTWENEDDAGRLVLKINGIEVFFVSDGDPEDSNLSRNFSDCYKVADLMIFANEAGLRGEEIHLLEVENEYHRS